MSERFRWVGSSIAIAGLAVACVACGSGSKDAPSSSTASATSDPAVPSPTNKGLIKPPPKAYTPGGNAADGQRALESEGYTVVIQNGGGDPGHRNPLSTCRIVSVDGLRGDTPPANSTVYMTVAC